MKNLISEMFFLRSKNFLGGLKKGFFSSNPEKKSLTKIPQEKKEIKEEIVTIKANKEDPKS
jgi:hypothetical protein